MRTLGFDADVDGDDEPVPRGRRVVLAASVIAVLRPEIGSRLLSHSILPVSAWVLLGWLPPETAGGASLRAASRGFTDTECGRHWKPHDHRTDQEDRPVRPGRPDHQVPDTPQPAQTQPAPGLDGAMDPSPITAKSPAPGPVG